MGNFLVRFTSRVVIYDRRAIIRLATEVHGNYLSDRNHDLRLPLSTCERIHDKSSFPESAITIDIFFTGLDGSPDLPRRPHRISVSLGLLTKTGKILHNYVTDILGAKWKMYFLMCFVRILIRESLTSAPTRVFFFCRDNQLVWSIMLLQGFWTFRKPHAENTHFVRGSITVRLTSCLTGSDSVALLMVKK